MKQPKNKTTAILLYIAPYICAVICLAIYGLVVHFIQNVLFEGYQTEQSTLSLVLSYVPIAVALIIVATVISNAIAKKYDLSCIGIIPKSKKTGGRASFLTLVVTLVCVFVSLGFSTSVSYISKKEVGGSPSYYITETGFLGLASTSSILSSQTDMEYDGNKYTISLSNGKKYTVIKNTKAGEIVTELFFG